MASNDLGQLLRKWRGKRTQDDVAKLLGVSRGLVSQWETGAGCPGRPLLHPIAESFRLTEAERALLMELASRYGQEAA